MKKRMQSAALETRAIHAAAALNETPALTPPIFQTSTFELPDASSGARYSTAIAPEHFYTRWGNPTIKLCEKVMAELEGAEAALAFSSGMAALTTLFLTTLKAGDHVIIGRSIYAGVRELADTVLRNLGIEYSSADARDLEDIERQLRPRTRLVLVETPTNPTLELCDLEGLAKLGKARGVLTAVDGTFATPVNQQPLGCGIDIVAHAATKGLGGHSDLTAGILCGPRPWMEEAWKRLKLMGACLSPFEAWLLLRGLKTLCVRVRQQNRTASELAGFLQTQPQVARVHYPGLPSHAQHELAVRQMDGFGSMVSFELRGGNEAAVKFCERVGLVRLAVSLGGVESLVQHPASMTHGMLSPGETERVGIAAGLLRLSVGLEHVRDLKEDITRALEG